MRPRDYAEARVGVGMAAGAGEARVSRAVVDDHALPVPEGLAPHAAQAGIERRRGVEDGQQDRDAGSGHR